MQNSGRKAIVMQFSIDTGIFIKPDLRRFFSGNLGGRIRPHRLFAVLLILSALFPGIGVSADSSALNTLKLTAVLRGATVELAFEVPSPGNLNLGFRAGEGQGLLWSGWAGIGRRGISFPVSDFNGPAQGQPSGSAERKEIPPGSGNGGAYGFRGVTIEASLTSVLLEKSLDFGGTGNSDGRFINPSGICADYMGNIFVVDSGNDRVQKFSPDGGYLDQFGEFSWEDPSEVAVDTGEIDAGAFNEPLDAVTGTNFIFVLDAGNHRISKFDRHFLFVRNFGGLGRGDGQFDKPAAIDRDESQNLYVLDAETDSIQKLDIDGNFMMRIGRFGWSEGFLNNPTDLACAPRGEIWVADTGNSRLVLFDEFGNFVRSAGSGEAGGPRLNSPCSVALDAEGFVYAGDRSDGRIVVFGRGGEPVGDTGPGTVGTPGGMVLISDRSRGTRRIYVTDRTRNRVSVFSVRVDSTVSSVAVRLPDGKGTGE